MSFEQFPRFPEHQRVYESKIEENRAEKLENAGYEGAVNASFILAGAALGLIGTEGCDIDKILVPEAHTKIVTVSSEVKKKFEEGFITFNVCVPLVYQEEGKTLETQLSTLIIEDANQLDEKGFKKYYGARFIKNRFTDSDMTSITMKFFGDNQKVYAEPCKMQVIPASEHPDRYQFLVENLNLRLNAFQALKQTTGAVEETQAVRAQVQEFVDLLNKEYPHSYDAKVVEEIFQ